MMSFIDTISERFQNMFTISTIIMSVIFYIFSVQYTILVHGFGEWNCMGLM